MKKQTSIAIFFVGIALIISCRSAQASKAVAEIKTTLEQDPGVSGTVHFEETPAGLKVTGTFTNVPPGKHGFHIHENGDCSDTGKAAGGHFNPDQHPHGNLLHATLGETHAGDLSNITISEDGTGSFEAVIPGLTLSDGTYNVLGRSVIVHEKEDDFSQPLGNAGGRIGCGIISKAE